MPKISDNLKEARFLQTHEIRSPELQEVMAEIPGSIIRWGLFLFTGIVLAILSVGWLVRSPDIVTAPLTITTFNPPVSLIARSGGKIGRFFINNRDYVTEKKPVVLIWNQATWEDIQSIAGFIDSIGDTVTLENMVGKNALPSNLNLGEMQNSWLNFTGTYTKFNDYFRQAYLTRKLEFLDKQIVRQYEYIKEMRNQEALSEEDLKLTYNSYKRDSNLFHRSSYSISINEFEKSKQVLLQKQVSFSSLRSTIKNAESSILKMKESRLDLMIQNEKEMTQLRSDLEKSYQMLRVTMGQWKEKYLIESPVKGKITFTRFWIENQVISPGDLIATIIPENPQRIIVRAKVAISGSGKVKQDQEVNIKLSGYPYMEFGVLKGRISSISLVPVDDSYIADIELTGGMKTSYNLEIGYINGMTGMAEIITENPRLIYRIIKPLRSLIKN